ncbi:MAG: SpoIID/LytB domain-containing protein [Candidatus Sumerlaeaceae bacterium]
MGQLDVLFSRQGIIRVGLGTFRDPVVIVPQEQARIESDGQQIDTIGPGHSVTIRRDGSGALVFDAGATKQSGQRFRIASDRSLVLRGHVYWGNLVCSSLPNGVQVINEIFLEDYIACVLAAEIGNAPAEALKAQAVVARSEIVNKLASRRHKGDGFDLCASEHCMAYNGAKDVTMAMQQACSATRGTVLMANAKVLDAVFHNMCGGLTACAEDVWDSPHIMGLDRVWDSTNTQRTPAFRSEEQVAAFIASPPPGTFCDPTQSNFPSYARKYFRWTRRLDRDELARCCGAPVRDLYIVERTPSGRVRKLAVVTANGTRVIEKELPIRRLFDLPSGFFVMRVERRGGAVQGVEFLGAGSGHGVGLCQMGAWSMAEKGFSYEAILRHYYPNATLRQIYR